MVHFSSLNQFKHLKQTVYSTYGSGFRAWFNYIYYGLFRINIFRILQVNLEEVLDSEIELPGISFCSPTISELDLMRSNKNLPREFFCDKFQQVSKCCIAKVGDELAYIHWIYFPGDFSRFLRLKENSAEINYVITLPDYRGRGICTRAIMYSMVQLKKLGVKKILTVVHDENVASIKSFKRAGFSELTKIISFGHFNKKYNT